MTTTTLVPEARPASEAVEQAVSSREWSLAPAIAMAAAASLAAGLVHAGAAGSHSGTRTLALLFAFAAVTQIGLAAAIVVRPRRTSVALAALANAVALAAWIFTRLAGVAFIDGLEEPQAIGLADASAAALEALAAAGAVVAMVLGSRSRALRPAWGAILGAAALVVAVPGMAAPHEHVTHEGNEGDVAAAADGHNHDASATATDGDVVLGVRLPAVEGVTGPQKVKAAQLINDTRAALAKFPDVAAAQAAGFLSIGDGRTGFEHFVNARYLVDANVLDPSEPESLVFEVKPDGTKTLASAMYILPPGKTMADVPDVAGAMTQWHDHQNLCWDASGVRLAGILVNGRCTPGGTFRPTPPMLHVWVTDNPCGPFAGIEGSAHTGPCHAAH